MSLKRLIGGVCLVLAAGLMLVDRAEAGEVRLLDSPCRLLDTRSTAVPSATGYSIKARGNPGPGATQGGQTGCGVPTYADGLILNLIVVSPSAAGHGKLWADGDPEPVPSSINFSTGETTNDGLTVRMREWDGSTYDLTWKGSTSASVVIDVVGFIAPSIETLVGQATGLFDANTLVVETRDGEIVKVFAPGLVGDPFMTDWQEQIPDAVGSCVHIDGYWFNGVPPLGHNTMEAVGFPIVMQGDCGPVDPLTVCRTQHSLDIRYSETASTIWVPGTSTTDLSIHGPAGRVVALSGQASQPGSYLITEVDPAGKFLEVSPTPETATDQALDVVLTSGVCN
jgi:hypothetical protein